MFRLTRCLPFKCTFKQAILSGRLFFSIISYHFFRFHLTLLTKTLSTDFNRPVFILKKGSVIVIFHKNKTEISKIRHLKNSKSETQYRKKKHSAVDFRTRAQVHHSIKIHNGNSLQGSPLEHNILRMCGPILKQIS